MRNDVSIFYCCVMLIGAGTLLLVGVLGSLRDPLRLGMAAIAMIFAVVRIWIEVRKPARHGR